MNKLVGESFVNFVMVNIVYLIIENILYFFLIIGRLFNLNLGSQSFKLRCRQVFITISMFKNPKEITDHIQGMSRSVPIRSFQGEY